MKQAAILLLAATGLAPSHGTVAQPDPASGAITLQFDWPIGMRTEVVARRFQVRDLSNRSDTANTVVSYLMHVRDHPDGRLVEYDQFQLLESSSMASRAQMSMAVLSEQLGALMPSLVISHNGDLLRLDGLDRLRQETERLLRPIWDSLRAVNPTAQRMLDAILSERFFLSKAAEEWNALVGTWSNAEFEVGALYEAEADEASPLFPTARIPFQYHFSLTTIGRCPGTAEGIDCVTLQMVSEPDPERMKQLLTSMAGRMAGRSVEGQIVYEDLEIRNTVVLVAEPTTLIPYSLEITQATTGRGREGGGEPTEFKQVRVRSFEFSYR